MSRIRTHRFYLYVLALLFGWTALSAAGDDIDDHLVVTGNDTGKFSIFPNNRCPDDNWQTSDKATGRASYLGRITVIASECVDKAAFSVLTDGLVTMFSGNGKDSISATYTGSLRPADDTGLVFIYATSGYITGGTGRFEGATGTFSFLGGGQSFGDGGISTIL
jgi:uncharacterized membrane protein YgcG